MEAWFSFVAFAITAICVRAQTQEPAAVVVRPPALTTATAGQTIRLTCVAYGYPLPSIAWTSGNRNLADQVVDQTVTVNETTFLVSVLQLCDLTLDDAAEYMCTASNGVSGNGVANNTADFFLTVSQPVTEPPAIVVRPPEIVNTNVDDTVEMVCVAYGNPVPNVIWSRPGCSDLNDTFAASNVKIYSEIVTSGNTTFRKSVMQICSIKVEDNNQYTCTAENGVTGTGHASRSVSFQVKVAGGAENSPTSAVGTTDGTKSSQEFLLMIITIVQGVVILVLLLVIVVVVAIACKASKKKDWASKDDSYSPPMSQKGPKQKALESDYAAVCDINSSGIKDTPLTTNPAYGTSTFHNKEEVTYERVDHLK